MPRLFGFIEIDVEGHEQAVLDGAGQKELAKDNPSWPPNSSRGINDKRARIAPSVTKK